MSEGDAAEEQTDGSSVAVAVENIAYDPEILEIAVGTEVTWTNNDGAVRHTVTSGEPPTDAVPGLSKGKPAKTTGVFNGDLPEDGATFSFTFDKAGTFAYFCEVHPSMFAEVVVE